MAVRRSGRAKADLEGYMRAAILEARESLREGNHGFGAVLVAGDRVLARAHDTEETDSDPTAHAELSAIRKAGGVIGGDLSSCLLVSTHEPCPMCAAAVVWARIPRVAFGYGIPEAVSQGRRRIGIRCGEIFDKAGAEIEVKGGILKEECAVLYDRGVREEVRRLRDASHDALKRLDEERRARRLRWYAAKADAIRAANPLEKAYRVLLAKFGILGRQAPVVRRSGRRIVFHSRNFCPTLEACKILGLDTRVVCRLSTEGSTDALVKQVDPALSFGRNYAKIRPYSAYCEEFIGY